MNLYEDVGRDEGMECALSFVRDEANSQLLGTGIYEVLDLRMLLASTTMCVLHIRGAWLRICQAKRSGYPSFLTKEMNTNEEHSTGLACLTAKSCENR